MRSIIDCLSDQKGFSCNLFLDCYVGYAHGIGVLFVLTPGKTLPWISEAPWEKFPFVSARINKTHIETFSTQGLWSLQIAKVAMRKMVWAIPLPQVELTSYVGDAPSNSLKFSHYHHWTWLHVGLLLRLMMRQHSKPHKARWLEVLTTLTHPF